MQLQVSVPGPVLVQLAFGSHPPLVMRHALIGAQVVPSPLYPSWQAQDAVPASVTEHAAAGAHPPLFTTQAPTVATHVVPLPE